MPVNRADENVFTLAGPPAGRAATVGIKQVRGSGGQVLPYMFWQQEAADGTLTELFLWPDSSGRLRMSTSEPTYATQDSAGRLLAPTAVLPLVVSTATNLTITAEHFIVVGNPSANATYTLPAASSVPAGRVFIFKRVSSSASVAISRAGSDTIDGAASKTLGSQYAVIAIASNGSDAWHILWTMGTIS
jgi:hypothetical protein